MASMDRPVWVIGHKNPDTDSICSAISYAYLKNATEEDEYIPKKAGSLNEETKYVLKRFGVQEPETVKNVGVQLKDIDFRRTEGVDGWLSLKKAWEMMQTSEVVMLPVVGINGHLTGIIVNGDIAYSYMNVSDSAVLSRARTPYKNIIETINGTLVTGNEHATFVHGKVVVATGNRAFIHQEVEGDDLVILGDVVERQEAVLEEIPSCMIVTGVTEVDPEVVKTAEAIDCVLITTEYDSFTTARLINQAAPIHHFMTKDKLITFQITDYLDEVREVIGKIRHRDFPILDESQHYVGVFSRRHLINPQKKRVILVDHNEKSQAVDGIDEADILEIIDHHKIGTLETIQPIFFRNMPLGCCCTIIYHLYLEKGVEIPKQIAGLLLSAILSDTLMFRSPTCTPTDKAAAEALAKIAEVDSEEHAMAMFEAGSDFGSKSIEELVYQDFKTFSEGDVNYGVSQISAVTDRQLDQVKDDLQAYLENVLKDRKLDMSFVMMTNILDQTTRLLCAGKGAQQTAQSAFPGRELENGALVLPGVVSRKKQMIPAIVTALQEEDE